MKMLNKTQSIQTLKDNLGFTNEIGIQASFDSASH